MDKALVSRRIENYKKDKTKNIDLQKEGLLCDLQVLNNTNEFFAELEIESMVYCEPRVYTYSTKHTDEKKGDLVQLYSQEFKI
jgi:hypothetical protein